LSSSSTVITSTSPSACSMSRRRRRATSSASPLLGSSGTLLSERELASAALSSRVTISPSMRCCFSFARTSRLLLATFTLITGGVSVPSSVSKMSARLLATSPASPLRSVSTLTERSLSVPGVTSSCRSISSAASSAVGVAEMTTAFSRSSAITRSAGSVDAGAAPRPRGATRAASLASSCSTSGAICAARACFRNTVRTRAASRGPRTSMSRTVFSISSSCAGSAATTIELLVISGVIVGLTRPGRDTARAATACSIARATVSAVASDSEYTRISTGASPSRGLSSCVTTSTAIGMSSAGAVMITRALSGSATTLGSMTGAPALAADVSDAGHRERSDSTAPSVETTTSGATCRSWITLKSACGAANALPSSSARMPFARSVPSTLPTITIVPDCGSAESSMRDAPAAPAFSRMRRASSTSDVTGALVGVYTAHERDALSESRSSSLMRPSATLMMRAAPETISEFVRASLSTRTGGVGVTTPRVRRMRSSASRGSVSCWSASSFCTSGAMRAASALRSAKVLASTESSAGRSSSGAISLSASSRSVAGPTMRSAFDPVAAITLTASGSRVDGLVALDSAWPRLAATSVASA
jgi:hypothetical protein